MIRRSIQIVIFCLLLTPGTLWAKKDKTVAITDTLFTDQKYHFSMNITKNWKVKRMEEPSIERAYLEKINFPIRPKKTERPTDTRYVVKDRYGNYGANYTIPSVIIYAEDFDGTVEDFETLVKKGTVERQIDSKIIPKLDLSTGINFIRSGNVKFGSINARYLLLNRYYSSEELELYFFKQGGTLFVIKTFSDSKYFRENKVDFDNLLSTFRTQFRQIER